MPVRSMYGTVLLFPTHTGKICTSKDVPPCSALRRDCQSFDPPYDEEFPKMFPKAYAQVCVEPSGEQCLFTDLVYDTCAGSELHAYCLVLYTIIMVILSPLNYIKCKTLRNSAFHCPMERWNVMKVSYSFCLQYIVKIFNIVFFFM